MAVERLEVPIAKAEYLLRNAADAGKGGDKRKFWHEILGFEHPESVREAILAEVAPNTLKALPPNAYGQRYQAIISITGPTGRVRLVKTIWIVRSGEVIARFVTAVPHSRRKGI